MDLIEALFTDIADDRANVCQHRKQDLLYSLNLI